MTPDEVSSGESTAHTKISQESEPDGFAGWLCAVFRRMEVFVKIVILSDIHANLAALDVLPERDPERDYAHLWCAVLQTGNLPPSHAANVIASGS